MIYAAAVLTAVVLFILFLLVFAGVLENRDEKREWATVYEFDRQRYLLGRADHYRRGVAVSREGGALPGRPSHADPSGRDAS